MFDFLPPFLKRLYQSFRVPYARGTRVRAAPEPAPEIAVGMRERAFRVEIIQDAFCERRPRPERLFRKPSGHRSMESWCDLEVSRYPTTRHRCAHCTDARDLYKRANQGDWQAECRLHRLATRASMRLLAERRAWAETRRRQRAARTPEPGPPPVIWITLGWKRWRERRAADPGPWYIVERRAAEAKLVRAHTRKLSRAVQRHRARQRDRELARERAAAGCKSAQRALHHLDLVEPAADGAPPPGEKVTNTTTSPSSRGAQRRGDPGQRDKRPPRGPGSPRRQSATRSDDAHAPGPSDPPADAPPPDAPGPSEPPAEAAPPLSAPAQDVPAAPARPKIALIPYPPGSTTIIKIGAARWTIPAPDRHTRTGSSAAAPASATASPCAVYAGSEEGEAEVRPRRPPWPPPI
ncbi:MAG TPA: hypothetical protein VJY39_10485 [Acidisphaera sp.]|nr:hypothetical protein [Acidisphaera sp.]